jgi:hypothetical protein
VTHHRQACPDDGSTWAYQIIHGVSRGEIEYPVGTPEDSEDLIRNWAWSRDRDWTQDWAWALRVQGHYLGRIICGIFYFKDLPQALYDGVPWMDDKQTSLLGSKTTCEDAGRRWPYTSEFCNKAEDPQWSARITMFNVNIHEAQRMNLLERFSLARIRV